MDVTVEAWEDGGALRVKVRAGARRDRVGGSFDGHLRVETTTAPERGKANRAVLALLARALEVPPARLALLSGETDPRKRVGVRGLPPEEIARRLQRLR